jgi:hypothetical protein
MARRKRKSPQRPGGGLNNLHSKPAGNRLLSPTTSVTAVKRPVGWCFAETSDALTPWRSDNAPNTRGKQS